MSENTKEDQIFAPIGDAVEDPDDNPVTEIESMCMNCGENGMTRLMMTAIPYFREVILMSFNCDNCGESNNEVQFGGKIQEKGCRFEFTVTTAEDLNRQIIKSDSATISVPSLEFEIPPGKAQRMGEVTTLEGLLSTAAQNLALMQTERERVNPELAEKVAQVIRGLSSLSMGDELPFLIVVDDPAGNSFVENPRAPRRDPNLSTTLYTRTADQDRALGFQPASDAAAGGGASTDTSAGATVSATYRETSGFEQLMQEDPNDEIGRREVLRFPSECPHCNRSGDSLMCMTEIPHFKEIIIMAFDCEFCGFKNNEVKGGGAIPSMGTKIVLTCEHLDDFSRDVLKSDSAFLRIPDIDLEIDYGSLGGMYTTVEGLLKKMKSNLVENNPFFLGDSSMNHHGGADDMDSVSRRQFEEFLNSFDRLIDGHTLPFRIEIVDPLGNSFVSARVGSMLSPDDDPQIVMHDYERTDDENDVFGIAHMVTENYDEDGTRLEGTPAAMSNILSDRLTQNYRKAPDHPHTFTKGMNDQTVPLTGEAPLRPGQRHVTPEEGAYYAAPDDPERFEASATFQGRKEGKVFRSGSLGVGYYHDKYPVQNSSS